VYSHPSKARPIESTEVSPVTCDQDIALQADGGDKNWSIFFGEYQGRVDRLGDRLSGSEVHPRQESIQYLNPLGRFRQ